MQDLESRFLKLEKSHRRLQRANVSGGLLLLVGLLIAAQGADGNFATLRVGYLEVIDQKGRMLVQLGTDPQGSGTVKTLSANGQTLVSIGENNAGGMVELMRTNQRRVGLYATEAAGRISTYNNAEKELAVMIGGLMWIKDDQGRLRSILGAGNLKLLGENGQAPIQLFESDQGGTMVLTNAAGKSLLQLKANGNRGLVNLMNDAGTQLVGLGGDNKGQGMAVVSSKQGKTIVSISAGTDTEMGVVSTFGPEGGILSQLGSTDGTAGALRLYNNKGPTIVGLGANNAGVGAVSTFNEKGKELTRVWASDKGFDLISVFNNDAGQEAVSVGAFDDGTGGISTYGPDGKERVRLAGSEAGGELQLKDLNGTNAVLLGVETKKGGAVWLLDSEGKPRSKASPPSDADKRKD